MKNTETIVTDEGVAIGVNGGHDPVIEGSGLCLEAGGDCVCLNKIIWN